MPDKKNFYSSLNIEYIADADYRHAKELFKEFKINNLGVYLSAHGLAWQACLKETGIKLELLTDTNMLMMVEKGIRVEICHAIHSFTKTNNINLKKVLKNQARFQSDLIELKQKVKNQ